MRSDDGARQMGMERSSAHRWRKFVRCCGRNLAMSRLVSLLEGMWVGKACDAIQSQSLFLPTTVFVSASARKKTRGEVVLLLTRLKNASVCTQALHSQP